MAQPFPPDRVRLARRIALAADVLQVLLLPAMLAPPVGEAINLAIDVAVGATMCVLLRPHWAFAPAFVAEAFPVVDVIPFWWASVLFVTRDAGAPGPPMPTVSPGPPVPPKAMDADPPSGAGSGR